MRLVFRADASPDIGTGHVMRCSALAEEAIDRGLECLLVGSLGGISWLEERYASIKCRVIPVDDFSNSEGVDVLIVDSYALPTDDIFFTQYRWKSRVDIIDECTPLRPADLFIHPGLDGQWFMGNRTKFLFGPEFIPIRKSITKNLVNKSLILSKLVIFGGGADSFGFAEIMSQELCALSGYDTAIFFSTDRAYIEGLDSRFKVVPFGSALDEQLSDADLVFTTASTSSIEVIARELPVGIACAVDNQVAYYEALSSSKVATKIGERVPSGEWKLRSDVINGLIIDSKIREEIRFAAHDFVDLLGAKRILDAIVAL
jgi:spore coat polysaccharide biosynthesis predicted glycosyltransferase SpsG